MRARLLRAMSVLLLPTASSSRLRHEAVLNAGDAPLVTLTDNGDREPEVGRRRVSLMVTLGVLAGDDHPGGWAPERFRRPEDRWPGHWAVFPADWSTLPDQAFEDAEVMAAVRAAIDDLPARQRSVVILRDVLGWTSPEVCSALSLSGGNERVLLHRGRSAVRRTLEAVLEP